MRRSYSLISALVMMAVLALPALAQWPAFREAGVPRNPDGKPNLTAPAPRTADGKPDLSGIWNLVRPPAGQRGQRGQRGQDGQPAPPPPPPPTGIPVSNFKNIGSAMSGGL